MPPLTAPRNIELESPGTGKTAFTAPEVDPLSGAMSRLTAGIVGPMLGAGPSELKGWLKVCVAAGDPQTAMVSAGNNNAMRRDTRSPNTTNLPMVVPVPPEIVSQLSSEG